MKRSNVSYVELTISTEDKEYLNKITNQIVAEDQFYFSDVMPHIKGNVTPDAHFTFFYGLDPSTKDDVNLRELIDSFELRDLKLGEFILLDGFQGLYKVLCVEVLEENRELSNFVNKIRKFSDKPNSYQFRPHITLAYVTSDFSLPITLPVLKESVKGEELRHV